MPIGDDLVLRIVTEGDDADARATGSRLAAIITQAIETGMANSAKTIANEISTSLTEAFKKVGAAGKQNFRQVINESENLRSSAENLTMDFRALEQRARATRDLLTRVGAPPELFAVVDRQIDQISQSLKRLDDNFEAAANDRNVLLAYRTQLGELGDVLSREVASNKSLLLSLRQSFQQAFQIDQDKIRADSRERVAVINSERSRLVAATQQETTLRNAEIRTQGQLAVATEQRTARRRIEIMKFAFRQIQTIERSIGAAFKASAAIIAGAFARIERTVFRIGGVFRRSNDDISDGFGAALSRRERLLGSSLNRQERELRASLGRQSAIIDRFDAQASTGVFGALSGRSRLGALFGGGLALGGGFAAFQGLRRGFDVGGDFVQGLAVLQAQLELTDQEIQKVREQSIELGNDITLPGVSALDAAQGISLLTKQFAALGDQALPLAQRAAKGVLQLSRATASSAEDAAQIIGASINVFGIEASKATQVADQITTALSKAAGVGFNDFSLAFRQAAAVFAQFQEPALGAEGALTELNTAIAVLAKGGLVGSDAGTSLKQLFLQANRDVPEVNKRLAEVTERAGEVGTVFFDEAGNARALSEALDILRRGLAGLNDQQRTSTLQKIFGSDATRAAAILVGESAESYAALAEAINREGAAADIAAAQNTGLRGALDALSSVLETRAIKTYERYQAVAGQVVLRTAELIDAFFEGEGAAKVLRSALTGLAAALGALLVAKAAAEAVQFLGIALRFALTPMGALVVAVGALGAAVGALRAVNENFRFLTDGIRIVAGEALGRGIDIVTGALRTLAEFLLDRVFPAIFNLAQQVLPLLAQAVRIVSAVFTAVLIPAAQAGFGYLVDIAEALVPILREYLIPAVAALGAAWFALNAPIAITITAFAAIGAALYILRQQSETVRTFTDNLAASFVNLGQRLAGIGRTVAAAAASAFSALTQAIGELFSRIDFQALGLRILGFVNTLGRLLGQAITSRLTVRAVVAIGVAAAALAGAFLAGFVEGVVKGLPGAIDEIINQIEGLLRAAGAPNIVSALFSNAFSGVGAVIVAAILATSVIRSLTAAGSRAAGAFSAGFVPGVRSGLTNAFRGLEALRSPEQALQNVARRQAQAYQREFARIMRDNARLGLQSQVAANPLRLDQIDATLIRRLTAEQEKYIRQTGQATASALLFRRTWGDALRDTGNRWQALQDRVAQTGGWAAVGRRAGVALVSAFGAALAGTQGGTAGLVGVVGATLGALAVGGPIVAGITAIAGGATLLWAELNKADEAAKLLLETTRQIVETLRGLSGTELGQQIAENLRNAVTGAISASGGDVGTTLSLFPPGFFTRTAREIEEGGFDIERSLESVLRNLDVEADPKDILDAFRLDPALLQQFLEGNFTFLENEVGGGLDPIVQRVQADVEALSVALDEANVPAETFIAVLSAMETQAIATEAAQRALFEETRTFADGTSAAYRIIQDSIDAAIRAGNQSPLDRLKEFDTVRTAVETVVGLLDRVGAEGQNAFQLVKEELAGSGVFLDAELTQFVEDLLDKLIRTGEAASALVGFSQNRIGLARFDGIGGQGRKLTINRGEDEAAAEIQATIDALELERKAWDQLNAARTDRIQAQIEALRDQLTGAEEQATRARQALLDFLTGGYGDSAQQQLDQLIGRLGGIGSQIEEGQLLGGLRGEAQVRSALGDFGSGLSGVINAAIEDGITTQEGLRQFLAPLFGVLNEEFGDGLSRIISTVGFDEGISGEAAREIQEELNRVLGGTELEAKVQGVFAADREVERIQTQLDGLEASLNVRAEFSGEQIQQALLDAGIDQRLLLALNIEGFLNGLSLTELQAAVAEANATTPPAPTVATPPGGGANIGEVNVVITTGQTLATGSAVVGALGSVGSGAPLPPNVRYIPGVLPRPGFAQ